MRQKGLIDVWLSIRIGYRLISTLFSKVASFIACRISAHTLLAGVSKEFSNWGD